MNKAFYISLILLFTTTIVAQLYVSKVANLPEPVSNNAVCEGFLDDIPFVYSFGGIDSSKSYSGIHLRSYRYNSSSKEVQRIPDLPDTLGKIACAASRIGNTIYISGGYHVFENGNEISSNRMHRYDIINNVFLEDGQNIPIATDDHVQDVWRDSLIYLITGWSNTTNIPNVQIYNSSTDRWSAGTSVPNSNAYKSFGASGVIVEDTIYYYGGSSSGIGFNIQNHLRKGVINPQNPHEITWTLSIPGTQTFGYRMAATVVNKDLHWVGGSSVNYNFDGIAYNGSGGVMPAYRDLAIPLGGTTWEEAYNDFLPMDLRGIANVNDTLKFIAGGMQSEQRVSNEILKLEWKNTTTGISPIANFSLRIYPNPFTDKLILDIPELNNHPFRVSLFSLHGEKLIETFSNNFDEIQTESLAPGLYFLRVMQGTKIWAQKVIKSNQ